MSHSQNNAQMHSYCTQLQCFCIMFSIRLRFKSLFFCADVLKTANQNRISHMKGIHKMSNSAPRVTPNIVFLSPFTPVHKTNEVIRNATTC